MIKSIMNALGYTPAAATLEAIALLEKETDRWRERHQKLVEQLRIYDNNHQALKVAYDSESAAHTQTLIERNNALAVADEKQDAYSNEVNAHDMTKKQLRVCELRNQGLAAERAIVESQRDSYAEQLAAMQDRLAVYDASPVITDVGLLEIRVPEYDTKISKLAVFATVTRYIDGKIIDSEVTLGRAIVANNKNRKSLLEDVASIRKICGL